MDQQLEIMKVVFLHRRAEKLLNLYKKIERKNHIQTYIFKELLKVNKILNNIVAIHDNASMLETSV